MLKPDLNAGLKHVRLPSHARGFVVMCGACLLAACSTPRAPAPIEAARAPSERTPSAINRTAPVAPPFVAQNPDGSPTSAQIIAPSSAAPATSDATPITPQTLVLAPFHPSANRPYRVLGRSYTPDTSGQPYRQRGVATWYGRQFHRQKTASGELFDMYALSAAHTTLPIPSYVRVTHSASGRQVVVRVNDRGPFKDSRLIDLSYAAARELGFIGQGMAEVEVELLSRDEVSAAAGKPLTSLAANKPASTPPGKPLPSPQPANPSATVTMAQKPMPAITTAQITSPSSASVNVITTTPPGFFAQLGAFKDRASAERLHQRSASLANAAGKLLMVEAGVVLRVMLGPYASRLEAEAAGQQSGAALGVSAFVHERR